MNFALKTHELADFLRTNGIAFGGGDRERPGGGAGEAPDLEAAVVPLLCR